MKIKTVTGSTIQAALAEARKQLGEGVLLLESIPAEGDRPATIKVVVDHAPSAPVEANLRKKAEPQPAGYGYGAHRSTTSVIAARQGEAARAAALVVESPQPGAQGARASTGGAPRGRGVGTVRTGFDDPVGRQLAFMQERLGALEQALTTPSASPQAWRSVQLLRNLADQGLREKTLARLFERVQSFRTETGLTDGEAVLIRNELRRMLQMPVLRPAPPAMLVLGSAGSGKTSLLLKLAAHPEYFGRRRAAVVVVQPDASASGHYSPIDRYRQAGVAVQCVRSREEMRTALERIERFDHLLIDTPSLPVDPQGAASFSDAVERIVQDVVPLQVQLVLDASRVLSAATLAAWKGLSLRPTSAAVTHLDEAHQWGRFAEWLMHVELPYGYAADGPAVPDHLSALSASRIAEHLCTSRK